MKFKTLIFILWIAFVGIASAKPSRFFVVHIHGDWCPTCVRIDPTVHRFIGSLNAKDVQGVIFDESTPESLIQSQKTAAELGLMDIFEYERHTGEVLFINAETKQVVTRFAGVYQYEAYQQAVADLLAGKAVANREKEHRSYVLSKPKASQILGHKVYIIDVHHDLCGTCQKTVPIFEACAEAYRNDPDIVFFTFDLSDRSKIEASRNLANELGLLSIFNSQKHTGEVLFVSAKDKSIKGRLVAPEEPAEFQSLIQDFIRDNSVSETHP